MTKTWEDFSEKLKSILVGPTIQMHADIMELAREWSDELVRRNSLPQDIHGEAERTEGPRVDT